MKIFVSQCQAFEPRLMKDLAKYKTVNKWISKMLEDEANFAPSYLSVYYGGEWYHFIKDGETVDEADDNLSFIVELPRSIREIWNDRIVINADIFENELSIYLDVLDITAIE